MDIEAKDLIDRISKISDAVNKDLKPLIKELAKNFAKNIKSPEIVNMAKIEEIIDPQLTDIATLLNRLRKKYDWSFSKATLYKHIQSNYKKTEVETYDSVPSVRITDNYIKENWEELEEKIKKHKRDNTPAKDIITKARVEDMERYTWNCHVAEELALLAIKMEHEHEKHEDKLCKEYAKKAKMVRDSRFATDSNSYDAIILACNSTQSLKNAISGEWEFKTVWEVKDDEDSCTECIQENCRSEKCNHECHRVIIPMTTKGLKYAIKTNEDLSELDGQIKRLMVMNDDLCSMGKKLLNNPKTLKLLGKEQIEKLLYAHIEKYDC